MARPLRSPGFAVGGGEPPRGRRLGVARSRRERRPMRRSRGVRSGGLKVPAAALEGFDSRGAAEKLARDARPARPHLDPLEAAAVRAGERLQVRRPAVSLRGRAPAAAGRQRDGQVARAGDDVAVSARRRGEGVPHRARRRRGKVGRVEPAHGRARGPARVQLDRVRAARREGAAGLLHAGDRDGRGAVAAGREDVVRRDGQAGGRPRRRAGAHAEGLPGAAWRLQGGRGRGLLRQTRRRTGSS